MDSAMIYVFLGPRQNQNKDEQNSHFFIRKDPVWWRDCIKLWLSLSAPGSTFITPTNVKMHPQDLPQSNFCHKRWGKNEEISPAYGTADVEVRSLSIIRLQSECDNEPLQKGFSSATAQSHEPEKEAVDIIPFFFSF